VPRSAPHANPAEIFPFEAGAVPADDRAYFEMLSWFVFGAGLNFRLLRAKWAHFLEAFENFDVPTVADYGEPEIDRLLADPGIVRHGKKIVSTVQNAGEIIGIEREHGDVTAWLRGIGDDTDTLQRVARTRFHHIGAVTSRMFLVCCGALEYGTWVPTERQRLGRRR
jgi:3-methyladenine DNA glycosylase Tag